MNDWSDDLIKRLHEELRRDEDDAYVKAMIALGLLGLALVCAVLWALPK